MGQLPTTANTNMPPWGAIRVQSNAMESPPAVAAPIRQDGMTRRGSDAA